jgi:hypothetical protein
MQPQLGIAQQIGGARIKTAETLRVELNHLPRRNCPANQGEFGDEGEGIAGVISYSIESSAKSSSRQKHQPWAGCDCLQRITASLHANLVKLNGVRRCNGIR